MHTSSWLASATPPLLLMKHNAETCGPDPSRPHVHPLPPRLCGISGSAALPRLPLAARRFVASLTFYASPDLLNWLPVRTMPNPTGVLRFTNSDPANFGTHFYRARAE